jgi:hypothetical protein
MCEQTETLLLSAPVPWIQNSDGERSIIWCDYIELEDKYKRKSWFKSSQGWYRAGTNIFCKERK